MVLLNNKRHRVVLLPSPFTIRPYWDFDVPTPSGRPGDLGYLMWLGIQVIWGRL